MSEQYPYHHQQQPPYDQYGQPVPQPSEPQPPFPYEPYQDQQQYTQTWEGQTWDTQYQPTIPPAEHRPPEPAPYRPRHAQPWQEGAPETAYLPPQGGAQYDAPGGAPYGTPASGSGEPYGTTSVPLPPEMPMASAQAAAPLYEPAATPNPAAHSASPAAPQANPNPYLAEASAGTPAGGAAGPAYNPPTTVGNARITDAQRARAEGRSPIIAPGMRPAALTAVLGLLLAVAAPVGPYALVVPVVLLQAVTAAGWFRLNGMWPARQGIALAFAGGLVADVALLALGRENGPAAILGTLGAWVLLTLVLQLRSHADPDERMYGLMATVASAALAILAGGALAAPPHAVSVGAAAVAVAVLARALPLPAPASVAVALLAAAGAGIAVGGLTGIGASGALLGLAAGACALIGLRVASYDYPSRFVHMTAGVALPLTAAVPVLYLIGRAVA
ncbi:hypothetical protein [Streptomyces sp. NBC_00083]|uniref:hypothetical protein n=1 Tax=Streptomyces sp. NBC_00083 TaxID=2975647 RepID=UPI0022511F0A|nr:hypothetical protein [Streptomyces sp. NBC_00083]MCX5387796.1 hypothetical protein [Streptomyces sp. NBC_00083]